MMSERSTLTYVRRAFTKVKRELVDEFERRYLLDLLGRYRGDLSAVRQASGLSRRHLGALVAKHGLTDHVARGR
jgi:two-component system, NtrC family, response regulator GlrR